MNIFEKLARCDTAGEVERMLCGTGHVVVPVNPTLAMIQAGSPYMGEFGALGKNYAEACYRAMIGELSDQPKSGANDCAKCNGHGYTISPEAMQVGVLAHIACPDCGAKREKEWE